MNNILLMSKLRKLSERSGIDLKSIVQYVNQPDIKLHGIDMSDMDLDFLSSFVWAETMDISDCNISELPDLSSLTSIRRLVVSNNNLAYLPKLPERLLYLNVSHNKLESIDHRLDHLLTLDMTNNDLEVFDHSKCPDVQVLYASHNKLAKIDGLPTFIVNAVLSNNPIESVAPLTAYKSLYEIDLSDTKLKTAPVHDRSLIIMRLPYVTCRNLDELC